MKVYIAFSHKSFWSVFADLNVAKRSMGEFVVDNTKLEWIKEGDVHRFVDPIYKEHFIIESNVVHSVSQ